MDEIPIIFARQPIMTAECKVFGYELLYRAETRGKGAGGTAQSARVLCEALGNIGIEKVVGDAHMFVNFDEALLKTDLPGVLPPGQGVVEIVASVKPTQRILATLVDLRNCGIGVAVDNFEFNGESEAFLGHVDYIKVDTLAHPDDLESMLIRLKQYGVPLIAEKVETHEQAERCKQLGFDYFQGYFFARPENMQSYSMGASQLGIMALVIELQNSDTEAKALGELIGKDLGLTHQILRLANSAAFRRQRTVGSIAEAVVLLGQNVIRQWASVLMLTRLGRLKPPELLALALTRARMCQVLGRAKGGLGSDELFTAGLLSVLDALLDRPMESVVGDLPLATPLREALCGSGTSTLGQTLQQAIAYETGNWSVLGPLTAEEEKNSAIAYAEATHFARLTIAA